MESKVLSVFFGTDLLPYKDSERTVHYPVGGNAFAGSNNTNQIRFYVDEIGGTSGISWVVVSKLPNGTLGYEPISTIASDSDLGEDYLIFDLSSYYTQYKGVVKLALRGYQGNITFTDSDSDGIYEINGNPLIEVTGTIDLAINYSPFVNTGAQLLPTDVDRILASLSNYALTTNTVVVVSALPNDLSAYNEGQLFFNKADKSYYIYTSGSLVPYDMYSKFSSSDTLEDIYNATNGNWFLNNYGDGIAIMRVKYYEQSEYSILYDYSLNMYFVNAGEYDYDIYVAHKDYLAGSTTLSSAYNSATIEIVAKKGWVNDNFYTKTDIDDNFYTQLQVDGLLDNYVDKGSIQTISGNKTFSGTNTFSGRTIFSGYANLYNSYLDTNNKNYFVRVGITTNQYVTYKLPYNYSDVGAQTYTLATQEDISNAIATVKANAFTKVDTTTHPTLNDFLASIGEEGYIYLYPIDTSDLTKGYYQYIWEDSAWLDIGTTQIDLSDYVEKTTTIAGVDLQDNITSSELLTALGLEFTDVEIDED